LEEQPAVSLPRTEDLRRAALSQVVRQILRIRSTFLPIGAILLAALVIAEPTPVKIGALSLFVLLNLAVTISDRLRLKRTSVMPIWTTLDVVVIVLLQTGVIFLTGAIESPLIVAYVLAGLASGIALGWRSSLPAVVTATILLWAITLGGLFQLYPRTFPSFLGLELGFADDARYVITKAVIINLITIAAARLGSRVNDAILKVIGSAIDARQQALEVLQDRNRELVHLSSAIAHELKNPLASVQGLVQLLERGGANAEKRFEVLNKEIARMRSTLDEFLNLSRPLGELSVERVGPASLFEELAAFHEGLILAKEITLAPASGAPLQPIACDPRKLKQALTNLLQNAIEATPAGGKIAWIAQANGETVSLGVEDTGPGIAPELIAKAADVGVTTKAGGSGIGLAVARSIAEQHGGKLVLENRAGGGLRAVLELPAEEKGRAP
jgi:signal transduction histidine kinase